MDEEFDDAALWAVIDSAAASHTSSFNSPTAITTTASTTSKFCRPLKCTPHLKSPRPKPLLVNRKYPSASPSASISTTPSARVSSTDDFNRPLKISRNSSPNSSSPQQLNVNSPIVEYRGCDDYTSLRHCLANQFPTVSLFKDYQEAAMSILEKSDYIVISGNPFIKKSGWRKIAFYFNVSFEIRDKTIEFDENRNVQRAEFVARAYMQGGRFSDGWGSCERREKKFLKPNHDIPSTAETRAKNRACQDLLGIGQYRPGVHHSHPR